MRAGTRGALCVYVPYVLSASLEFLRAVARVCGVHVSLLRMWCSAWAVVSCGVLVAWLFVAGALRWLLHERHNASQP